MDVAKLSTADVTLTFARAFCVVGANHAPGSAINTPISIG